jgi:hypothetical protein
LFSLEIHGPFGSDELMQTGDFVIQALNAVAFNVGCLAENMENQMENLTQSISGLTSSVGHLSIQAEMYQRKSELVQLKSLAKAKPEHSGLNNHHHSQKVQKQTYK